MNDLKFAFRQLLKNPGFTAVAVLTLALGIGANLAVVSLANGLFFRPLPGLREVNRLVIIGRTYRKEGFGGSSYPDYRDLRASHSAFGELAAFAEAPFSFSVENSTERLLGELVSGNYFRTLGVTAILGRTVQPEDDQEGSSSPVAAISYRFWQKAFGGDSDVLRKPLSLNGTWIPSETPPSFWSSR